MVQKILRYIQKLWDILSGKHEMIFKYVPGKEGYFRLLRDSRHSTKILNICKDKLFQKLNKKYGRPNSIREKGRFWIGKDLLDKFQRRTYTTVYEGGYGMLYHNSQHTRNVVSCFNRLLKVTNTVARRFGYSEHFSPLDIELMTLIVAYHDYVYLFYPMGQEITTTRVSLARTNEYKSAKAVEKIINHLLKKKDIQLSCAPGELRRLIYKMIGITEPHISINPKTGNLTIVSQDFDPKQGFLPFFFLYTSDLCQCGRIPFYRYIRRVCSLFFEQQMGIWQYISQEKFQTQGEIDLEKVYTDAIDRRTSSEHMSYVSYIFQTFKHFFSAQTGFIFASKKNFDTMILETKGFDIIFGGDEHASSALRTEVSSLYPHFENNLLAMDSWYKNIYTQCKILEDESKHRHSHFDAFQHLLEQLLCATSSD